MASKDKRYGWEMTFLRFSFFSCFMSYSSELYLSKESKHDNGENVTIVQSYVRLRDLNTKSRNLTPSWVNNRLFWCVWDLESTSSSRQKIIIISQRVQSKGCHNVSYLLTLSRVKHMASHKQLRRALMSQISSAQLSFICLHLRFHKLEILQSYQI